MNRSSDPNVPWEYVVTVVGAVLALSLVVEGILVVAEVYPLHDGFRVGVASSLPFVVALAFGGYWLGESSLSTERHERIGKWCLGGCLVFVVLVVGATIGSRSVTVLLLWSTVRWAASIGGGVGFLIGVFEARAIEQVIESEQLRARQQQTERERDRLEEFASVVSHDLRNPLNVAEGRLELARRECDSGHLDDVERAHDRMAELIEDLLELARAGARTDALEPVALADVLEESWHNVAAHDATLRIRTDRTIVADETRLRQLLENLLRNAVEHSSKHSPTNPESREPASAWEADGGVVTITVGDLDDGFFVADDGPGIPEEDRTQVFEMGYTTREGGTGFGLAIAKEVVDAHDWKIRVIDSADGGARFEITGVA